MKVGRNMKMNRKMLNPNVTFWPRRKRRAMRSRREDKMGDPDASMSELGMRLNVTVC